MHRLSRLIGSVEAGDEEAVPIKFQDSENTTQDVDQIMQIREMNQK